MAVNRMSVGKDYSISYYDTDSNSIIDLGDVQDVTITARKHNISSMPYNDVPRFGFVPDGYDIKFSIVRTSQVLEEFQLAANTRFNSGQNTAAGFLNETIRNPDNSVSRYQYTGFVFWLGDVGTVSREKTVMQKAEGLASDKKAIS